MADLTTIAQGRTSLIDQTADGRDPHDMIGDVTYALRQIANDLADKVMNTADCGRYDKAALNKAATDLGFQLGVLAQLADTVDPLL